ncbi:MAG: hypothetical protein D6718_06510 [Acidobacteria bacterium]|nr:MAG: hypothetical protein D6718_06510 [Acidobacteriota bacterium]
MTPRFRRAAVLLLPALLLAAVRAAPAAGTVRIPRVAGSVRVDGVLDEPLWNEAARIPVRIEVYPSDNVPAAEGAECLVAYDEHRLYVAFRAREASADEIRAFYADRDRPVRDDLVGFVLDPFGDRRRGFLFLVNPLGVQLDASVDELSPGGFHSLVGAPGEDYSWDALWESAGRITAGGFQVEIVVPFSSLRFPRREGPQEWGFIAFRVRPRTRRHRLASVPIDRDRSCFLCQAGRLSGLEGIEQGRDLELDPTVTVRSAAGEGTPGGTESDAGLTAHWGVSPDVSLDAALNPDFSQVEADAAQIEINRRFTLFFPEKRPFFLEAQDFFRTPLFAVNTRSVADPDWGIKLTGKRRRDAFGVFAAQDRGTTFILPGAESSDSVATDRDNRVIVGRYRRDVGGTSTLGLLLTDRRGPGYANRVAGADGVLRISDVDRIEFQALRSRTRYPDEIAAADADGDGTPDLGQPRGPFAGSALRVRYERDSRLWGVEALYERLDAAFRADVGFVPRVDLRRAEARIERIHWGGENAFWNRLRVGVEFERAEDGSGALAGDESRLFVRGDGPWQSILSLSWKRGRERFGGTLFDQDRARLFYNIRPSGTFTHSLRIETGDAIDVENGRQARVLSVAPEFTLNLGRHLFVAGQHDFQRLEVAGERLFTVNLSQLRAVYQFTLRFFVRLIAQYRWIDRNTGLYACASDPVDPCQPEPRERSLFDQLLLSYKVNPRTVLFAGYEEDRFASDGPLERVRRTVFLKLGYAWLPPLRPASSQRDARRSAARSSSPRSAAKSRTVNRSRM